jgi:hypothetical protein
MKNQDKFNQALTRVFQDEQPVQVTMSKRTAFCIIPTIQLACRHPKFCGPTRDVVEDIARKLGDSLSANDPDLKMLVEMGWNPLYDEEKK